MRRKLQKENLVTPRQVSVSLKCHINTVYSWVNSGTLKAYKTKSGRIYMDKTEVQNFLKTWYPEAKNGNER